MRIIFAVSALFLWGSVSGEEIVPKLLIEKIQKGVYLHKSFNRVKGWGLVSSNGLIAVENEKAFIIDTPWSERDTEKLVKWISENNFNLLGSISTHSHEDRTAGIKWLNDHSIPTYASALTNQILEKNQKVSAKYSLEDVRLPLANGLVEVFYPGGGHTIDNIVVWLPSSKVLFGGCFVRSLQTRNLGYTGEATIDKWANSVDRLLSKYPSTRLVVPGHGEIGNIQLLKHTKQLAVSASN